MKKIFTIFLFLWAFTIQAQNIISVVAGNDTTCAGFTEIPVTVQNLSGVAAISLALEFNTTVLDFDSIINFHPSLNVANAVFGSANGYVFVSWYDTATLNISGDTLFTIRFLSNGGGSYLDWNINQPGLCEFADINGDLLSANYVNGAITSGGNDVTIIVQSVDQSVFVGSNVSFTVVAQNASSYYWQVSYNNGLSWDSLQTSVSVPNVQSSNLIINPVGLALSGNLYRCLLSGPCSSTEISEAVELTVDPIPQLISVFCGSITSCADTVIVPVWLEDGNNLASVNLSLAYDETVLSGFELVDWHPLADSSIVQSNAVNGHFYISAYSTSEFSIGNDTLFYIKLFTNGGTSSLIWDTQVQGACEFADGNGDVINSEYNNGNIISEGPVAFINNQLQDQTVFIGDPVIFQRPGPVAFSYQWFVSVDSGLVWEDISNYTYIYADANKNLKIDVCQALMSGFLFKCAVTGTCPPSIESDIVELLVIPVPPDPQEIEIFIGSVTTCPDTILVPVTTNGFYDVASISLALDFDPTVLTFDGVDSLQSVFGTNALFNSLNGKFFFSWYALANQSILADTLFMIKFISNGGTSELDWDTQTNGICEFSDLNGAVIMSTHQDGDVISGGFVSEILGQPQDSTIIEGNNVSFSVLVPGPIPTYIWQESIDQGQNWSTLGVTSATLALTNVALTNNGYRYRCIIFGTCPPNDTSQVAVLHVNPAPPPPQHITVTLPTIANSCTGNLHIPIIVEQFENVGAISMALSFDTASLSFDGFSNINQSLSSNYLIGNDIEGTLFISWLDPYGATFATTDTLFSLDFISQGGSSNLSWKIQTPGYCEFTNPLGSLIQSTFDNGLVSVVSNPLLIDAGPNDTIAVFDSTMLDVQVAGGVSPYNYNWYSGDSLSNQYVANPIASPLSQSDYSIQVTDANNCMAEDYTSVIVIGSPCPVLQSQPVSQIRCEGDEVVFSVEASGVLLNYQWQFNGADISGAITDTFTISTLALSDAGSYSCIVYNPYCSDTTSSVNLSVTPLPIVNFSGLENQYCLNAEVDSLFGNPNFGTFSGSGIANQMFNPTLAGTGTHEITYTYTENNCTNSAIMTTVVVDIPQLGVQTGNVLCFGDSTGYIDISVIYGNFPFLYNWSNGTTNQDQTNIPAGLFSLVLSDGNNCQVFDTIEIIQNPVIAPSFSTTMVSLFNGSDGTVSISPSGGIPPYSYLWDTGETTDSISSLPAGEYFITISDSMGCSVVSSVIVHQPHNIQLEVSDVTCYGLANGQVDVEIIGGFPPFTYLWSTGETISSISNLDIGIYIVTITDAQSADHVYSATVVQPSLLQISPILAHVSCNAGADGAIDITVVGGTPSYYYNWSNGNTTEDIDSLIVGNYSLTITDMNGCELIESFGITQPALPISIAMTISHVSCYSFSDGSVTTNVTGGTSPYSYNWSNGTNAQNISGLIAGNYYLNIIDAKGCTNNDPFQITQPNELVLSTTTISTSCYDSTNGSACVVITGGTSPYSIAWNNQANSNCIQYLASGNYFVTVSDDNGCTKNGSAIVGGGAEIILGEVITHVGQLCAAGGEIQLNVTGGMFPYTYSWAVGDTISFIDSLNPGYYPVQVSDSNNCIKEDTFLMMTHFSQTLNLISGWDLISTFIIPYDPNVAVVFAPAASNMIIMKNGNGSVYWPAFNLNQIINMVLGEGYQVNMSATDTLQIEGLYKEPELHSMVYPAGWSIIGYLRLAPASIDTMLSSIISGVVIVKNGNGQVYWPLFGLNMIGNMIPGKGYQIKMLSAQSFTFVANSTPCTKSLVQTKHPQHFNRIHHTGNNMTLGLMLDGLDTKPGDEVAVFSMSGLLVGSAVVNGSFSSIAIWGNDELTDEVDGVLAGEEFEIRIWDSKTGQEKSIIVDDWMEGDGSYETNKIAVAGISNFQFPISGFQLFQNVPNPFSGETEFSFYLPKDSKVEFDIFNLIGEEVATIISEEKSKGKHSLTYNSQDLAAGTYYYRLKTPDFEETKKMVVVKR